MSNKLHTVLVIAALACAAIGFKFFRDSTMASPSHDRSASADSAGAGSPRAHSAAPNPRSITSYSASTARALRTMLLGTMPTLNRPLAAQLADLETRAKQNDAEAALALWSGLHQCNEATSDLRLRQVQEGDQQIAAIEAKALDNCKDVPAEMLQNEYQWLKLAAALGNPQAQYQYAEAQADAIGGERAALHNPHQWQEYRDTAMSYLDDLAKQCNPTAINFLWYGYGQGIQLMAPDLAMSYKYLSVAYKIDPAGGAATVRALDTLAAKLGQDQSAALNRSADQFYSQYCTN